MSAKEAFEIYKTELNGHDFTRLIPLISEQCNFWHPTGTCHGMAEARKGFERAWEMIQDKRSEFSKADWIVESESTAICTYTYFYSGVVENQKIYEKVHGTTCFRLEEDRWKIFHEHLSHAPE